MENKHSWACYNDGKECKKHYDDGECKDCIFNGKCIFTIMSDWRDETYDCTGKLISSYRLSD